MFSEAFWGLEGYEELRKYLKHGVELSRDIAGLLQERADLELNYAKVLSKLGTKMSKATQAGLGTSAESWALAGAEMESEAELHRIFGQALLDDVCKLMKSSVESLTKSRKPVESVVDKASKSWHDRHSEEGKCKKNAFALAKEREKMIEQANAARDGKSKNVSEKDLAKLEKKVTQLEETLVKADKEYYDNCRKTEAARQDWELNVFKACGQLQAIEEERIVQMQDMLNRYNAYLANIGPKLIKSCEKIGEAVYGISVSSDIQRVSLSKGRPPIQSEQILLDFYAEDRSNHMEMERRRRALQSYLITLDQDLEKERKGRDGVAKLMDVYRGQPSFCNSMTQEDGHQRLANVDAMLRYLEASQMKISSALAEFNGQQKPQSQYIKCIERNKDKQGIPVSILRTESLVSKGLAGTESLVSKGLARTESLVSKGLARTESLVSKGLAGTVPSAPAYRPPADGGHNYPVYEDEFDSFASPTSPIGHCIAMYDFLARDSNELTIAPGDVISIFLKHEDGWWQGELRGKTGVFPASYVK